MSAPDANGWLPIETAPKPKDWLRRDIPKNVIVARFLFSEGEGDPVIAWAQVVNLSSNGWMAGTGGFKSVAGYAEFPVNGATHWALLPPVGAS